MDHLFYKALLLREAPPVMSEGFTGSQLGRVFSARFSNAPYLAWYLLPPISYRFA